MRILGLVVLPGNQAAFKKEASRWHWVTFSNQSLKQIIPVSQYYMLYQFSRSPNISRSPHFPPPKLWAQVAGQRYSLGLARGFTWFHHNAVSARNPLGVLTRGTGNIAASQLSDSSCRSLDGMKPLWRAPKSNNRPLFHQAGTTDLNHFNQHPVSIFTKLIKTNLFVW